MEHKRSKHAWKEPVMDDLRGSHVTHGKWTAASLWSQNCRDQRKRERKWENDANTAKWYAERGQNGASRDFDKNSVEPWQYTPNSVNRHFPPLKGSGAEDYMKK